MSKLPQEAQISSRQARSEATQTALMRAAEKLIAERGLECVSIRDIVAEAGQKNESALQYHFKSIQGLIRAIRKERAVQVQQLRGVMLDELLATSDTPTVRELCTLMVRPAFELARRDVSFRRTVKAFGHELVLIETSAASIVARHGGGGESGERLAALLKQTLKHLRNDAYHRRMDSAVRLCSASMYHQARQKSAFRGEAGDVFYFSLIDALEGLLSAPESSEAKAAERKAAQAKARD